ncbi:transcriptional regulator [Salipiger abyssi]|uniref:Transcriptional regulator n=1 Tax=Salipiger abyssi TaxID=1250539 RepID=A0A1P8USB3_9RHOB|nr:transcriptional regulator [Salipiger abyssi]
MGIRIFNRTARAISLTDEGRRFYETVAPLLAGIEDAAVSAGNSKAFVRGRLRVNVDGTFGHYVLAPRLGAFLDRHPELAVEIVVRDTVGDLVAEGVDVAVRFGVPEPSSLTKILLRETRVLTCAAPTYVATHGLPEHPDALAKGHQCLLIRDPATGRPFQWEFQRGEEVIPFATSSRLMVNDTGSLLGTCLSGAGVAQLLEIYARDLIAQERLVHLLPDWADETFPLYAFHHSSNLISAKVRVFLEYVRDLVS